MSQRALSPAQAVAVQVGIVVGSYVVGFTVAWVIWGLGVAIGGSLIYTCIGLARFMRSEGRDIVARYTEPKAEGS